MSKTGPAPDLHRYQQVLRFRDDGWTYANIGRFYNITPSAAEQLTKRAQTWKEKGSEDSPTQVDMFTELAARVVQLSEEVSEKIDQLHDKLEVLSHPVPEGEKRAGRPTEDSAPPQMWTWIVVECAEAIGEGGVADYLGTGRENVRLWRAGATAPRAAFREKLRELLATLWAREIYADNEALYERSKARVDRVRNTVRDRK